MRTRRTIYSGTVDRSVFFTRSREHAVDDNDETTIGRGVSTGNGKCAICLLYLPAACAPATVPAAVLPLNYWRGDDIAPCRHKVMITIVRSRRDVMSNCYILYISLSNYAVPTVFLNVLNWDYKYKYFAIIILYKWVLSFSGEAPPSPLKYVRRRPEAVWTHYWAMCCTPENEGGDGKRCWKNCRRSTDLRKLLHFY